MRVSTSVTFFHHSLRVQVHLGVSDCISVIVVRQVNVYHIFASFLFRNSTWNDQRTALLITGVVGNNRPKWHVKNKEDKIIIHNNIKIYVDSYEIIYWKMEFLNKVLPAKWGWSILTTQDTFWIHSLKAKYLNNVDFLTATGQPSSSWLWKGILPKCLQGALGFKSI